MEGHWATQLQQSGSVIPYDIVVTDDGQRAFIAGNFGHIQEVKNTTTFSTSTGLQAHTTASYYDALLLKYQLTPATQGIEWAYQVTKSYDGSNQWGRPRSSQAADGSIDVAGRFRGVSLPMDFGSELLFASGSFMDGFVVRVDEINGVPGTTWARQLDGAAGSVNGLSVAVRASEGSQPGTVFLSGHFLNGLNIAVPIGSATQLTPRGESDVFLVELSLDGNTCVDVWQSKGDDKEEASYPASDMVALPFRVNLDIRVSASGSVYQLFGSTSPIVATPGGSVETEGGRDVALIHLNPDLPRVAVTPQNSSADASAVEQRNALVFVGQAIDRQEGDVSSELDST